MKIDKIKKWIGDATANAFFFFIIFCPLIFWLLLLIFDFPPEKELTPQEIRDRQQDAKDGYDGKEEWDKW